MSWRDLIIASLPPPSEGEPAQLRSDILEELQDHLECATRRELRRIDDPEQARKNAIERFGNPQAIARQLWLDAMKEQLMNQRIMIGTQLLTVLAMVALCIVVVMALRQNQRVNEALLAKLGSGASAPSNDAAFHWPTFKIRVRPASADKGIADLKATLQGEPYRDGEKAELSATTDADGTAAFGPIRPGSYSLRIYRGQNVTGSFQQSVTVPPGEQPPMVIQWPEPQVQMVSVSAKSNVPAPLEGIQQILIVTLSQRLSGKQGSGTWTGDSEVIAIGANGQIARVPAESPLRTFSSGSPIPADYDASEFQWSDTLEFDSSWNYSMAAWGSRYWVGKIDPETQAWTWQGHGVGDFVNGNSSMSISDESHIDLTLKPKEAEDLTQFAQRIHSPPPPPARTRSTTRPQRGTAGE